MRDKERELRDKWNTINYYSGGALKLAVDHPLEWYVYYTTMGYKSIVIVTQKPMKKLNSSLSIDVESNQRKDKKYATSFNLIENKQEEVFIAMILDIISFSKVEMENLAIQKVVFRYNQWLKLLNHKNEAILGCNEQKGLLAELMFLKEKIESGMPIATAIAGWIGPEGGDQDFVYSSSWYEIKSTGTASTEISISSVEQLDRDDEGELIIYRIDKCAPEQPKAYTLYGLVYILIDLISSHGESSDELRSKLLAAGYIDLKEYDNQYFNITSKKTYYVNDRFPRIRRKDISIEITNLEYQINIPSIKVFEK